MRIAGTARVRSSSPVLLWVCIASPPVTFDKCCPRAFLKLVLKVSLKSMEIWEDIKPGCVGTCGVKNEARSKSM